MKCMYCGGRAKGAAHAACDAEWDRRCYAGICVKCGTAKVDSTAILCNACRAVGATRAPYVGYGHGSR